MSAAESAIAAAVRRGVLIEEFSALRRNSLRGFATVVLPSGMILSDVSLHVSNGNSWASPPSKPMLDRSGAAMRDEAGKIRYGPIVNFATKELRDRFSDAVVAAVRAAHPDALADAP